MARTIASQFCIAYFVLAGALLLLNRIQPPRLE
jgi:hypothetical protein